MCRWAKIGTYHVFDRFFLLKKVFFYKVIMTNFQNLVINIDKNINFEYDKSVFESGGICEKTNKR